MTGMCIMYIIITSNNRNIDSIFGLCLVASDVTLLRCQLRWYGDRKCSCRLSVAEARVCGAGEASTGALISVWFRQS